MEKNLHQKEISVKIRRDEPIEVCGLTLYPLTMEHYEEFMNMKNVLSIRLSALPVQYMAYDYLNAIFKMDTDHASSGKDTHMTLLSTVLYLFELALRIAPEQMEKSVNVSLTKDHLIDQIIVMQNGKRVCLKSNEFSKKIRPVMARQNCVELPDESANRDLIEAGIQKREFYAQNEPDIVFDVEKMVSSVKKKFINGRSGNLRTENKRLTGTSATRYMRKRKCPVLSNSKRATRFRHGALTRNKIKSARCPCRKYKKNSGT